MLILGLGEKAKPLRERKAFCSRCEKETFHKDYEIQEYLSIFFIPLTYDKKGLSKCQVCGKEKEISLPE